MPDTTLAGTTQPRMGRDAILEAVASAAQRFLEADRWEDAIGDVLANLGQAAGASRAYVFQNHADERGRACASQRHEWVQEGVPPQIHNPALQNTPWIEGGFARWATALGRGEILSGPVRDLPRSERVLLVDQSIRSMLVAPLFVGSDWWGTIGFDDCERERSWSATEIDALRGAAGTLGSAILHDRTKEQLAQAETKYRALVERLPAATYLEAVPHRDEPLGPIVYLSPQFEGLLGHAAERWADPIFWLSLIHPEDRQRVLSDVAHSNRTGEMSRHEYRMVAADGRIVWIQDEATLVRDENGSPQFWQGFVLDITERKRAEERVREAEHRFRTLVEQIPAVVYINALGGPAVPTYISPRYVDLLGYTAEERMADPDLWARLLHPEDRDRVLAASDAAAEAGWFREEYRMVTRDGRVIWVREEGTEVPGEGGRPHYWMGFLFDITERKLAEEQAREAEARYRNMVESSPAMTYREVIDPATYPESSQAYISPQVERLLGYSPEEWSDTPGIWQRVLHPEDRQRVLDESVRTVGTGEVNRQEYRLVARDGRVRWFRDESVLIAQDQADRQVWHGVMVDITDLKQVEEQMREAEQRYRALVEHIPAVTYRESIDGRPDDFYIGPQVAEMLGYDPQEWTWTEGFWEQRVHPDDLERVMAEDERTNRTGRPFSMEYRFRAADGTYRWMHDQAAVIHGEDGEPRYWQGFMLDVTERKRAEEQMREAEAKYRTLVEQNPAVIYTQVIDEDDSSISKTVYISPQIEDMLGYSPEETYADPAIWRTQVHPDDRERVFAEDAAGNVSGEPFNMEYRMRAKDGHIVWVHDEATLVHDEQGQPLFWQGFLLDVTERKRAEEALAATEEKYRDLFENANDLVYAHDLSGRITSANKAVERLLGMEREDIVGSDISRFVPREYPSPTRRLGASDGVTEAAYETQMIARDGRRVPIDVNARLVMEGGRPVGVEAIARDVTEHKRAERELQRALDVEREASAQLRALDDMKNTFLQAVSHDLRTPLTAIAGLAVTLERGDVDLEPADAKDLAKRIAANALKLERMVTDLLDLDRLGRGIVEPKLFPADLGELTRRVVSESAALGDREAHVETEPITIAVDASKVERIIENLLANTARHTPADSRVWVRVWAEPDGAVITVEDDGPGVPEEHRDAIFEAFRQGPSASEQSPGVGIGLALVARFADLHGGRAWVQEREGGGASFRVFLPAEGPQRSPVRRGAPAAQSTA